MKRMSKYHDLYVTLKSNSHETVRLSFKEIESIIGSSLPKSAYQYPAWWANGDITHSHSNSWQDAGYKVDEIHFGDYVIFKRVK
jgi:hypothetical protein